MIDSVYPHEFALTMWHSEFVVSRRCRCRLRQCCALVSYSGAYVAIEHQCHQLHLHCRVDSSMIAAMARLDHLARSINDYLWACCMQCKQCMCSAVGTIYFCCLTNHFVCWPLSSFLAKFAWWLLLFWVLACVELFLTLPTNRRETSLMTVECGDTS